MLTRAEQYEARFAAIEKVIGINTFHTAAPTSPVQSMASSPISSASSFEHVSFDQAQAQSPRFTPPSYTHGAPLTASPSAPVTSDELKSFEGDISSFKNTLSSMASTLQSALGLSNGSDSLTFDHESQQQ